MNIILSIALLISVSTNLFTENFKFYAIKYQQADRNIDHLSHDTKYKFYEFAVLAHKRGFDFIITATKRTKEQQDALYAQGRTTKGEKVTWTKYSKHLDGRAFDILLYKDGKPTWIPSDYTGIGALASEVGLKWGGAKEPRDNVHFEN